MAKSKSSGNLKTDIKNAIEKNINGELDLDGYAEELSNSFKQFLTRQEFRVVKIETDIDVNNIRTTQPIPADVGTDTLFGPYAPLITMLKKIPGASSIFTPLEDQLKSAIKKVSTGGASIPKLDIGGQDGGDLTVNGKGVIDENYKGKTSAPGASTKTTVVLFKDEIND